jgi:predicted metal-dependent hydrolase
MVVIIFSVVVYFTDWKYHLFFKPNLQEYYVDNRVEKDVDEIIRELYNNNVPLHQLSSKSFNVSIDNCMPPYYWGIALGALVPNEIKIELNDDIIYQPKEFRKWVILHEFAHHFDFVHEDKLYIMYPYLEGKYDLALRELSNEIKTKINLDNSK